MHFGFDFIHVPFVPVNLIKSAAHVYFRMKIRVKIVKANGFVFEAMNGAYTPMNLPNSRGPAKENKLKY